ncbi:hypothetical protein IC229_02400 [Spirosoma sp. BT702]|uniref:Uncharacterized protein n=1 Tax=Spirosoma profusum TaxID=2771354 RepID=A0A926XT51_9BACT|nr:hypothetical protein [Spirosoma profusum]MBD2699472.1 hypothetical protein [Spirosoma profusum]
MEKIKSIASFVLENFLTITAIIVGTIFFTKSQPAPPPVPDALGLIFGLLSTMVISDFITRIKYLNKFRIDLDALLKHKSNSQSLFISTIPLKEELESSLEVYILANTGYKTIGSHDEACEKFLKKGGCLNVIVMNPAESSPATAMAASRSLAEFGKSYYKNRIENTLKELHNAKVQSGTSGKLYVKTCDIAPSFGLYIFQPNGNNARMYIRIFAHFESLNRNTNFFILKSDYPELFDFYFRQFKLIEKNSAPINIDMYR